MDTESTTVFLTIKMWPNKQTTVDVIRSIVLKQLQNSLPDVNFPERVVIYNQEYNLPPIDGLWVEIAFLASKIYATQNYTQFCNDEFQEVQNLYTQENIMVRLFSKNIDALRYKELVMMAFKSIYAEQCQEKYSFKIGNVIPFPDTSELEGGVINYRADLSVMCLVAYQNIISADYMNAFETQVNSQGGIPLMQETFNPSEK